MPIASEQSFGRRVALILIAGQGDGVEPVTLSEGQVATETLIATRDVEVVDENATATLRALQVGRSVDGNWLVESGLRRGEVVVLDGLQNVQPGSRVVPVARATQAPAVAAMTTH